MDDDSPRQTLRSARFWRMGLIMFLVIVGGLSILPYLMSTGAGGDIPDAPFSDSRFAEIEGVRLHYRVSEARPDPGQARRGQILLVHGLAGSSHSWRHVTEPLSRAGYRVVTVDLPPFGYSEPRVPGDGVADSSELLWGLLQNLEGGDDWYLLGHSMGAAIVARMAEQAPDSVAGLVMVSGTHETAVAGSQGIAGLVMHYPPMRRWLAVIGSGRLLNESGMERALASAYGQEVGADLVRAYLDPLERAGKPDAVIRFMQRGQPMAEPAALQGLLSGVIWGGHDEWVPLSRGRRLAEAADTELHLLDAAAHNPMETHPEAFLDLLLPLL